MKLCQGNRVRWWRRSALMTIAALHLVLWAASVGSATIHAGYFEHYPSCFTDANGTPRGIFVDLLDAIAAREGWRMEYHLATWDENVKKLERAEIDVLLSMVISEERLPKYTFSTVTIVNNWAQMFVPVGSQIQSLLDLQGKRVATLQSGYHTSSPEGIIALDEKFQLGCQFLFEDGYAEIIEALKQGRAEAGVLTRLVGKAYEHDPDVKKTGIVFAPTDARFALPKQGAKTAALIKKLDAHLVAMQNENTSVFYAILETYLGEQSHVVIRFPHWLLLFLPALGVGSLLLLTISLFFRWQLRRRTYELRQQLQKRKQTEEALRQSEERLAKVLEILPVGVWISDRKGVILHGNHAGQTIWTGARYVGPEQFHEYKAWWLATGKRITPKEWGVTRAITQGEVSHEEEIEIECFDGTRKIILNWAAPILGPDQQIEGAVAVNQDITERKLAEKALRESEERLRSIFENTPIGMFQSTPEGKFLYVNPTIPAMLKYASPEELIRKVNQTSIAEALYEDPARRPVLVQQVEQSGGQWKLFENRYRCKDGSIIDALLSFCERPDPLTGQRFLYGFVQDITERKRIEEALRESEENFRRIFEMSLSMICIADIRTATFLKTNPAFTTILGYSEEELQGRPFFDFIHPEDIGATHQIVERDLQQGKKVLHFINRYRCQDGTYRWLDWMSHPNPEKGVTYAIAHDITDRKQAEAEIHRLNAELEQRVVERTAQLEAANQELERFAYVTSHDLKAPLRGISQLASWLMTDYANTLDENGQHLCALLISRAKRMDALIDGILQYSRIGRINNAPEPAALAEIIAGVIEMLNPPPTIRVSLPPDLPVVKGDKVRLIQVFQNLLSNALNFMDKSDGRITIKCKDAGAFWTLSVRDNGPGISPRYHDRIFEIFQTLHARDEHESTGIGLALVKKIVELHGGTIWVESAPGQGSTFFFTLPKRGVFE